MEKKDKGYICSSVAKEDTVKAVNPATVNVLHSVYTDSGKKLVGQAETSLYQETDAGYNKLVSDFASKKKELVSLVNRQLKSDDKNNLRTGAEAALLLDKVKGGTASQDELKKVARAGIAGKLGPEIQKALTGLIASSVK